MRPRPFADPDAEAEAQVHAQHLYVSLLLDIGREDTSVDEGGRTKRDDSLQGTWVDSGRSDRTGETTLNPPTPSYGSWTRATPCG
jgi:hypothetical protein